jgi:hypothetical protein
VERRWKLWTGLVLVLLVLGVGGVLLITREPEPRRAYNRLRLGMTPAEVEAAIGRQMRRSGSPITDLESL